MFSRTNELRREFGNVLWILKCVFSKYRVVLRVWKCVVDIEMFSNFALSCDTYGPPYLLNRAVLFKI